MNRVRGTLAAALVGLLASCTVWAFPGFVLVGVDLSYVGQGRFFSEATISCFSSDLSPEYGCNFFGSHSVTSVGDEQPIANTSVNFIGVQWIHDFSPTGQGGVCYHGNANGQIVLTGAYNRWQSPQVCDPDPPDKPKPTDCPVILDLGDEGFHLTGMDNPVHFDLDASGTAEEVAWTAPGVRNAFLCQDRNHNGSIDNGRELFGQVTPLNNGRPAQVGYVALAQIDMPAFGGNGDGVVGPEDAGFKDLCVWFDLNHNGVSDPGEVLSLEKAGVVRLGYDYVETGRRDQYGNLFRYKSRAWAKGPAGNVHEVGSYDVFFLRR